MAVAVAPPAVILPRGGSSRAQRWRVGLELGQSRVGQREMERSVRGWRLERGRFDLK